MPHSLKVLPKSVNMQRKAESAQRQVDIFHFITDIKTELTYSFC